MSRNIAAILRTVELAKAQRVKRNHTTAEVAPAPVDEDAESYARFSEFMAEYDTFDIPDCKAVTPGLVKVSMQPEPASIYSPAGSSRIKFERPRKRATPDRSSGPDCELPPDPRRHLTFTVEDGSGRARGVVRINPFSKRIGVSGFGLTERPR
jgi:hypothetical protein